MFIQISFRDIFNGYCHISMYMSRVREIDIINRAYCFFYEIINIRNFDPNNIKIDEKSYKNILIYYIGYVTPNSLKPLYFININANGKKSHGNK